MIKTALIFGIGGQDGGYLAKLLLLKGYTVWGSSRDAQRGKFINLFKLGIHDDVQLLTILPEDFRSVFVGLTKCSPDEIYYLAGQSSVGLSFDFPVETVQSSVIGTLNLLECCRLIGKKIRVFFAGSSECFGDTGCVAANEGTNFQPRSPYGVAKSSSYWLVDNYRESYKLYVCTGILFNHESHLRSSRFVTQKIIQTAKKISLGSNEKLNLGRLNIVRDWGWAPEFVNAMWLMLQQDRPEDFVLATGCTMSLQDFVEHAFKALDLNWRDHVVQNAELFRPTDIQHSVGDPSKANMILKWKAEITGINVVAKMLE